MIAFDLEHGDWLAHERLPDFDGLLTRSLVADPGIPYATKTNRVKRLLALQHDAGDRVVGIAWQGIVVGEEAGVAVELCFDRLF